MKKSELLKLPIILHHPRSISNLAFITRVAAEEVRGIGAGWSRTAFATILAAAIEIR